MVKGLDTFKKYFTAFPDNYIVIGGTVCDIVLDAAGFIPRATKEKEISEFIVKTKALQKS